MFGPEGNQGDVETKRREEKRRGEERGKEETRDLIVGVFDFLSAVTSRLPPCFDVNVKKDGAPHAHNVPAWLIVLT